MARKQNNFYRQELLEQLINEFGFEPNKVNNASPRELIDMFISGSQLDMDADCVICLINGAYNIDVDFKYNNLKI